MKCHKKAPEALLKRSGAEVQRMHTLAEQTRERNADAVMPPGSTEGDVIATLELVVQEDCIRLDPHGGCYDTYRNGQPWCESCPAIRTSFHPVALDVTDAEDYPLHLDEGRTNLDGHVVDWHAALDHIHTNPDGRRIAVYAVGEGWR